MHTAYAKLTSRLVLQDLEQWHSETQNQFAGRPDVYDNSIQFNSILIYLCADLTANKINVLPRQRTCKI
jgi:hypothetical protein